MGNYRALSSTYPTHTAYIITYIAICKQCNLWCDNSYTYLAWACTIKPACMHNVVLGVVNRHGRSKGTISSIHGPCLALRRKEQSFYQWFWRFDDTYCSPWRLYLKICQFSVDDNDRQTEWQTDYFTPCACTWGNNYIPHQSIRHRVCT